MHLILSHLLGDSRYYEFYKNRRAQGDYLILDNSAHEFQSGESGAVLLDQAVDLNVQEVVCPDVLFDGPGTVQRTKEALEYFGSSEEFYRLNPRLMVVPQGQGYDEWARCLLDLLELLSAFKRTCQASVFTIGVSKDYEIWDGGLEKLIRYVNSFWGSPVFEIHLLGWGRQLWEYEKFARDFPWVRSVDSAKPFVFAYSGIDLTEHYQFGSTPVYPRRHESYFDDEFTADQVALSIKNLQLFENLVKS